MAVSTLNRRKRTSAAKKRGAGGANASRPGAAAWFRLQFGAFRTKRGLTPRAVASSTGIDGDRMTAIHRGEAPTLVELEAIATALGTTPQRLIAGAPPPP